MPFWKFKKFVNFNYNLTLIEIDININPLGVIKLFDF